jgi:hypothetical protein
VHSWLAKAAVTLHNFFMLLAFVERNGWRAYDWACCGALAASRRAHDASDVPLVAPSPATIPDAR